MTQLQASLSTPTLKQNLRTPTFAGSFGIKTNAKKQPTDSFSATQPTASSPRSLVGALVFSLLALVGCNTASDSTPAPSAPDTSAVVSESAPSTTDVAPETTTTTTETIAESTTSTSEAVAESTTSTVDPVMQAMEDFLNQCVPDPQLAAFSEDLRTAFCNILLTVPTETSQDRAFLDKAFNYASQYDQGLLSAQDIAANLAADGVNADVEGIPFFQAS